MRKSRFSEAQTIGMIKEQEADMPTAATVCKLKYKYGGREVSDARQPPCAADVHDLVGTWGP